MKKQFLILFAFISVLALSQVPQRFNKVIVTGDITSPKLIKTGSNADSVLLGNGSARSVNSLKTDTVNLSNRINAKAAGNGTANGTNTGDETLSSIKTKLGAATSVSDGYLTYNMFNIFNGKEPSFTKNTGFNKNFGTTPGTVLEGRTFGTAANSAVGDFIQNQNSSAQAASMWINGSGRFGINPGNNGGANYLDISGSGGAGNTASGLRLINYWNGVPYEAGVYSHQSDNATSELVFKVGYYNNGTQQRTALTMLQSGAATFASTVNSTGFLLNGNNLTSSLSTNYLPKWNGSTFVNASAGTDYQKPITLTTNGTSGAATFENGVMNVPNYAASTATIYQTQSSVSGSTGGSMVGSMPFQTGSYKKVILRFNSMSGNATYTFPASFTYAPGYALYSSGNGSSDGGSLTSTTLTTTGVTISGTSTFSGWIIIEGY